MKLKTLLFPILAALLLTGFRAQAEDTNTAASELKDLIAKINTSIQAGKKTEAEQADNIKAFDALIAKYKGQTNEAVARIAFMKATLYLQVFHQTDKGVEMLKQLQHDFPDSKEGKNVDAMLAQIKEQAVAEKVRDALAVGSQFPDFSVQDLDGKPLSVAGYKGKIVLVDFWATWCPPCRAEIPNIVKTYQKYHDKGFEIIGVSLDKEGDKDKLTTFLKDQNMTWRQYYDGKWWQNILAAKYGIQSIPTAFLLDGNGKIIATGDDVRGKDPAGEPVLGNLVAKTLAQK